MSESDILYEDTDGPDDWDEGHEESGEEAGAQQAARGRSKKVKVPVGTCNECQPKRLYYTLDGFKKHLKAHLFQELFLAGPGEVAIMEECNRVQKEILRTVLLDVGQYSSEMSKEVKRFIEGRLENGDIGDFAAAVANCLWQCFPLPSNVKISTFHHTYLSTMNSILNKSSVREDFIKCLKSEQCSTISKGALEWFITHYVRKMGAVAEAFMLRSMREPRELLVYHHPSQSTDLGRDDLNDSDVQQTVYYVGGSVVHSVLSRGMRYKSNPQWNRVDTFLRTKVLASDSVPAPEGGVSDWTQAINRGGLKVIGEPLYVFLMSLTNILRVKEHKDGSILHAEVMTAVQDDSIVLLLWDEVVGDSLSDEDSKFLLFQICYFFGNAWGAGAAHRHRNAIANRFRDKVALRASLVGKGSD